MSTIDTDSDPTADDCRLYTDVHRGADTIAESIRSLVVEPLDKARYEQAPGHALNQTLPDKQDEFEFEVNGIGALVLPDRREIVNHSYKGEAITGNAITDAPDDYRSFCDDAERAWAETFGEWRYMSHQPDHPSRSRFSEADIRTVLDAFEETHARILERADLELVGHAAANDYFGLLAEIFETNVKEIISPGCTDLSTIRDNDGVEVPCNDGLIAVLRPLVDGNDGDPVRGCVVGYDDTPVGIFAHVIDVTNLSPTQTTTSDVMSFDGEIDPFNPLAELAVDDGECVRLQGDLRAERVGEVDEAFDGVTVPERYVRGRSTDVPVADILDAE
ncbi:hypothetical protein ACFQGT_09280 [Natrialbaceae archaeon GCM10025810]|uniref:hypothetical protein n=1 Tax=Halovalidus salilacus TaxID=3075124 RepID=UPI0036071FF7